MQILDTKSDNELISSLLAELAKSRNELSCAQADLTKASSRLTFLLAVVNTLINRSKE